MIDFKRFALIGGLAAAGLASASGLQAFPNVANWTDDPSQGIHCGGGGIWGTGSQADFGIMCSHCHINNAGQQGNIISNITWSPLLAGGKWDHNQATANGGKGYQVTVTLSGMLPAIVLPNVVTNQKNGMVMAIEDVNGNQLGAFLGDKQTSCPASAPALPDGGLMGGTYAYGDCHTVASLGKSPGPTSWTFYWKPPTNAPAMTAAYVYLGVVAGDSSQTSLGDDVKITKMQVPGM